MNKILKSNRKKQLILEAFRTLDAEMLEVLLNDGQNYSDVSKELFIERYKEFFEHIKEFPETKLGFKVYPGECTNCYKGRKGVSLVNPDGECCLSLIFEENEDDYNDICSCSSFKTEGIEIVNTWIAPYFYTDERYDWKPTYKNYQEMSECDRGVKEITDEIEKEGILSSSFYQPWVLEYKKFDSIKNLFTDNYYKYSQEIRKFISAVKHFSAFIEKEKTAKELFLKFSEFDVITDDKVIPWLYECEEIFPYGFYEFDYESDFLQDYIVNRNLKFKLSELYYTHSVHHLMNTYWDLILPEEDSINEDFEYEDDETFPF